MVAFLQTLTDERVQNQQAPFDHPELLVPNWAGEGAAPDGYRPVGWRGAGSRSGGGRRGAD